MVSRIHDLTVTTPRLILRSPTLADLEMIHAAKISVWGELQQWMLWASDDEARIESTARFIAEGKNADRYPLIGINRQNGDFVVATGLDKIAPDIYGTGYWVAKEYLGQGYATESCNAMIRLCFAELNPLAICIDHYDGNALSQAVIRKLGFAPLDILPKAVKRHSDSQMVDLHRYVRTDIYELPELEVTWR